MVTVETVIGPAFVVKRRIGLRKYGIPEGGPFDLETAQLTNAFLGNDEDRAIIEFSGIIRVVSEEAFSLAVGGASTIKRWTAKAGAVVEVQASAYRSYLSLPSLQPTFESSETELLRVGEKLLTNGQLVTKLTSNCEINGNGPLRVFVPRAVVAPPLEGEYVLSHASSRLGLRLKGIRTHHTFERTSEPICPGYIQWTPSGELIIIGPDGPTIGGYPWVGSVLEPDQSRLARMAPGSAITFEMVKLQTALSLRTEWQASVGKRKEWLRSI